MANRYTVKGNNLLVARPFGWHVYEVRFAEITDGSDFDVTLDTLPQYTKIIDAKMLIDIAEVGAADAAGGIVLDAATDRELVAVASDLNVAAVISGTAAACTTATADLRAAALPLVFRSSRGAGAVTTPPVVYCAVLMGRVEY
jgi:hypothetical protein